MIKKLKQNYSINSDALKVIDYLDKRPLKCGKCRLGTLVYKQDKNEVFPDLYIRCVSPKVNPTNLFLTKKIYSKCLLIGGTV